MSFQLSDSDKKRFWEKVNRYGSQEHPNCWLWTAHRNKKGYGTIQLGSKLNSTRRPQLAHRVVWEMVKGSIPDGVMVLHKCDVPTCVNPAHLWLGTALDNSRDMISKGRQGSCVHPERLSRGDRHFSHRHPELLPRGDRHYTRLHPEKVMRGESNGNARLTAAQVIEIRRRYSQRDRLGETISSLARAFGIARKTLRRIAQYKTWKHVSREEE